MVDYFRSLRNLSKKLDQLMVIVLILVVLVMSCVVMLAAWEIRYQGVKRDLRKMKADIQRSVRNMPD